MMGKVYSFTNDKVSLELRFAGQGKKGYWLIQKLPVVEFALPEGLIGSWWPDPSDSLHSIERGWELQKWDHVPYRDLGVPSDIALWRCEERDEGTLDIMDRAIISEALT